MPVYSSPFYKYVSIFILILAILYQYEIPPNATPSDRNTFLVTKKATFRFDRAFMYKIISDVEKYPTWYPNVGRVEHVNMNRHEKGSYRLITKFPVIGDLSTALIVQREDYPKEFVFSVDSWLLETNSVVLQNDLTTTNITYIEWTVYTKRRSLLFQYFLLPFARFYKNQLVREGLFTLMTQLRNF